MSNKTGILLINLGTPNGPDKASVRAFLKEFLSDPRVIDLPSWIRRILLYCVILPFRTSKSTKAYQQIWDKEKGSPLLFHSNSLVAAIQSNLKESHIVELAMRYGTPSIDSAIQNLLAKKIDHLIVLPLFPQYSSAATGSAIESTLKALKKSWIFPKLTIIRDFYQEPAFIAAKAALLIPLINEHQPEKIIFSYHSLPIRHIKKGKCSYQCEQSKACPIEPTCYRSQCYETSRLLASACGLSENQYLVAFQSELGRTPWVGPNLQTTLESLSKQNIKNIMVACPSFVSDCLETLEEIGIRTKASWRALDGKEFHLAPCLNSHPEWISGLQTILENH